MRLPYMIFCLGDGIHVATGDGAIRSLLSDWDLIRGPLIFVVLLDQQPVRSTFVRRPATHPHQRPLSVQLLAMQRKFQAALFQSLIYIDERLPAPLVPNHYST